MQTSVRQRGGFTMAALLIVWLAGILPARAEDLTTLSGTTYHQVRMVRVEPDGVVWQHATGLCKVDFTDLPEPVRKAYHYDAKQAAAYQAAQAQAQQQAAEQVQQTQQEAAVRRAKHFQEQTASRGDAQSDSFAYRRRAADDPGVRSVGAALAAKAAEQEAIHSNDGTVWDRRLWAIPDLILGGGYSPGTAFDPHTDLNAHEYQGSLHHTPGGFAADSAHDSFFQPDYSTKAYNQDLDRAEAFARGHP